MVVNQVPVQEQVKEVYVVDTKGTEPDWKSHGRKRPNLPIRLVDPIRLIQRRPIVIDSLSNRL